MEWKPIDTAPKDGTDVLVFFDCATVPVVHIAWYRSREEWESSGKFCGGWGSLEEWEGWWSYTRNSVSQEKLDGNSEPTHWMPLPPEPSSGSDQKYEIKLNPLGSVPIAVNNPGIGKS